MLQQALYTKNMFLTWAWFICSHTTIVDMQPQLGTGAEEKGNNHDANITLHYDIIGSLHFQCEDFCFSFIFSYTQNNIGLQVVLSCTHPIEGTASLFVNLLSEIRGKGCRTSGRNSGCCIMVDKTQETQAAQKKKDAYVMTKWHLTLTPKPNPKKKKKRHKNATSK